MNLESIHIIGRHNLKDGKLYFYHAGTGVSFYIKGKEFEASIDFCGKKGFVYVIIDRNYDLKQKILIEGKGVINVKLGDSSEHSVDILKCNEERDNVLVLEDVVADGILLEYKHKYDYKIKVYGDSTIAGFGIHKKGGFETSFMYNDGVADFCYESLYELNTDIDVFASSGWGLSFSAYTNPKTIGIIDKFKNVSCFENKEWKSDFKPDLLIVSLGTNDFSYINENKDKAKLLSNEFLNNYLKLIQDERKENEDLPVLMIYGSLKEEQAYNLIEKTYKEISSKLDKVFLCKLDGDNSAYSSHSYIDFHKGMSERLKCVIKEILKKA